MLFNYVLLHFQKVSIVIWLVASQVNEIITEMPVQLYAQPVMISTVVVNEELRSHLGVEKGPKDRIFLPLHCSNKGSTIRLGHIGDCSGSKHGLKTSITCEFLWRNTPVMPIICVVMVFKEECYILKLSKHL